MGPHPNVRTLALFGGLLELAGGVLGVLDHDLDAGLLGEFVAHFLKAVVALVAVDPDEQFTFLGCLAQRQGAGHEEHGGGCRQLAEG